MSGGMWLAISVGMPIPRLTVKPSRSSRRALRMMPSRVSTSPPPPIEIPSSLPHGTSLDALLSWSDHHTVDEYSRSVNGFGIEGPDLDELFPPGDRDSTRRGGH